MADRPILFSGEMVRAILAGRKTVTRRVIRGWELWQFLGGGNDDDSDPQFWGEWCEVVGERREAYFGPGRRRVYHGMGNTDYEPVRAYAAPGDRLWVRETWTEADEIVHGSALEEPMCIAYRADLLTLQWAGHPLERTTMNTAGVNWDRVKWRPSIFLPRWASRLSLEVVSVRPERLHDITPEEIAAEGVWSVDDAPHVDASSKRKLWEYAWDRINGKRAPWATNPWVWRIEFRQVARG